MPKHIEYLPIASFGEIITGKTPSTSVDEYWYGDIPFITPTDIIGYNMYHILKTERYVSTLGKNSQIKTVLPAHSICVSCIASIGKICITQEPYSITNQQINSIIVNDNYDYKYIYYCFRYYLPYLQLIAGGTGSGTPIISKNKFARLKYPVHVNVADQRCIASLLSAYDDLIENNNKRIQILENIVKDWYQHKFSTEKIKDCSNLIKLGEIIQIIRGVSYSSEEIDCEDGNDLINLKNIQAFGGFRLDGTKKYNGKYKKEQIVKTGDLIMGVTDMTQDRRTVGSVALIPITQNTSVISADLIKIQSNLDNVFLYAMFRYGNISKYISQFANGANVLHLRPQAILNIKVFIPEEKQITNFAQKVKPILDEINILNEKNANLAKQRDLLLPRLMSGKLEIKGTDDA